MDPLQLLINKLIIEHKYLVAEGFIVDRGDGVFRYKSPEEIQEEVELLGGIDYLKGVLD